MKPKAWPIGSIISIPRQGFALNCFGAELLLLPERALYWAKYQAMIVADLHLGKSDFFRSAGQAVPSGSSVADLSRIDSLLRVYAAQRLIILGDFLHNRIEIESHWIAQWLALRAAHPAVSAHVVLGNHDRALAETSEQAGTSTRRLVNPVPLDARLRHLQIEVSAELDLDGIRLSHEPDCDTDMVLPRATSPALAQFAGHLHPAMKLPGAGAIGSRFPVFWRRETDLIFPAFSCFTGSMLVPAPEAGADQRVYVCPPL